MIMRARGEEPGQASPVRKPNTVQPECGADGAVRLACLATGGGYTNTHSDTSERAHCAFLSNIHVPNRAHTPEFSLLREKGGPKPPREKSKAQARNASASRGAACLPAWRLQQDIPSSPFAARNCTFVVRVRVRRVLASPTAEDGVSNLAPRWLTERAALH